jgi:hypothetical protein
MERMDPEEFERRSAEIRGRSRENDEYMIRRITELEEQRRAYEEAERRRAERGHRFLPFRR